MPTKAIHGRSVSGDRYPLDLPAYQKIANADHRFNVDQLYSFNDIARITGLSSVGVRQRAVLDGWPTAPVWIHPSKIRRPAYVSGDFLRNIQLQAGGQDDK
jgi:hypothetical protein